MAMTNWLFKEEPAHYSFDDLVRDKRITWSGVKNNLALSHLRKVAKGDRILYYHTGSEKAVVGIMEAVKGAYPDPNGGDPRIVAVDVKPIRRLARPIPLSEIKANKKFSELGLVRISRLSVMPVTAEEWSEFERLETRKPPQPKRSKTG
jgi:predicted RNA-binding protein with PUA-like domain